MIVPDIKQKEGQAVPYGIRRRMEDVRVLGMPRPREHGLLGCEVAGSEAGGTCITGKGDQYSLLFCNVPRAL